MKKTYTIEDLSNAKIREKLKKINDDAIKLNEWNAKDWEEKYKELIDYIDENFVERHPKSFTLDDLLKLKTDFAQWQLKKLDNGFSDYLMRIIKVIDLRIERLKYKSQPKTNDNVPETLSDIITHKKRTKIVEAIKVQYKNIKGKRLKLLLLALQKLDLLPIERIAKKFHTHCKQEFHWNIASYTAMNDYKYNEHTDKDEFQSMISFLNKIIDTK